MPDSSNALNPQNAEISGKANKLLKYLVLGKPTTTKSKAFSLHDVKFPGRNRISVLISHN